MRFQKPRKLAKRRQRVSSYVISQIDNAIKFEQKKYGVSRSFVIAVALAYTFGIESQELYMETPKLQLVKRGIK